MKKSVVFIVLCLILLTFVFPVSAASNYVTDEAGLLTDQQRSELEESCARFYSEYGMELVFLTVNDLHGSTLMAYADDYFDAHYGENGILLLISMGQRDWHISTTGSANAAFSDTDLMDMENGILPYLSSGEFYEGFLYFLSDAEYYATDEPVSDLAAVLFMTVPVGAVIAGIILLIMRGMMNSKTAQRGAASYETDGSYHLRTHQDLFLYSNISKRPKPQNNSSGSTTHRSSSGRSHGGRGGKF